MSWHFLQTSIRVALEIMLGAAFAGLWIWVHYTLAKSREDKKDHKADVQTLFDGKK
jgi:hypothetical protein